MKTVKELLESAQRNLQRAESPGIHSDEREGYARIGDAYTRLAEVKMRALKDGLDV